MNPYLAGSFWGAVLFSMAYGLITGDPVPLLIALLAGVCIAPFVVKDSDEEDYT